MESYRFADTKPADSPVTAQTAEPAPAAHRTVPGAVDETQPLRGNFGNSTRFDFRSDRVARFDLGSHFIWRLTKEDSGWT